ncbi:MAG: RNase adapter RapZ [Lautropia sp.]|nr:RNase adapter RapZ [Lautropia sp.]
MQLLIVTGMSGSGKSLAIHVLEDAGYYCIDNLPVRHVLDVALSLEQEGRTKVAMSIDARSGSSLAGLRQAVRQLRTEGHDVKVLFLNARTDVLVQRYSETRRRHPLTLPTRGQPQDGGQSGEQDFAPTLEESIERERELMSEIEDIGISIDTSDLHPNTLRQWVRDVARTDRASMTLLFESFAFKQGVPLDADLVFDVRCLPNPYYNVSLRALTGLDKPVQEFLAGIDAVQKMVGDISRFLTEWLPSYVQDNRHYLTIAIGCTGGQHRSVYVTQALAEHFARTERVLVRHRAMASRQAGNGKTGGKQTT